MAESLSIPEARKLVLLAQQLPGTNAKGNAESATLSAIEHLGYIQIDTLSVVQRAHHHTLWNRNPRYAPSHLDQLTEDRTVFEYWSHAAAFLPMRDYRFSLIRKDAFASGKMEHWFDRDKRMEKKILKRIRNEGPLMAKDFEDTGKKSGEWKVKPAKASLENLFTQGDLMISKRIHFHKVYDLTERTLPDGIDTSLPSTEEYARHLIIRFLQAHGLGQPSEIAYLRKNIKKQITATMAEMVSAGELIELDVAGNVYHALPEWLNLLKKSLNRSRLKILSPFDNLVIQRKRMQDLIECYVPAAKRRYGYFALPILWDGRLVARMDCKVDRKKSLLNILHLSLEPWLKKRDTFLQALSKELDSFMKFNQCDKLSVHKTSPSSLKSALTKVI